MITAQTDLAALAARLLARAPALAARRPGDWHDARTLWPLFAKD